MATGRQCAARICRMIAGAALLCLASACATQFTSTPPVSGLPPLQVPDSDIAAPVALSTISTPELNALTEEMRDFADQYIKRGMQRQRLNTLHASLLSPALVGIEYDPAADGTAAFAFEQGKANCLTYAHLFVAMARYVGLDARYLSLTLRPEWSRHGERVALRQHVNVLVRLRNGEQYMVDIDPVPRQRVASADILSDKEAYALYHGNLAMDALLFERKEEAYAHALKALELSDNLDYLWVNLGAIYSRNGQSEAAENAYQTALDINDDSPSAMNNLAVLYNAQGQYELAEQWAERVIKHRDRNPYYHYYLGAESEAQGDYERAIAYYLEAIELKDSDAEFHFRLAKLYFSLQKPAESIRYTEQAIERARLTGELKMYREFLESISGASVAGISHG